MGFHRNKFNPRHLLAPRTHLTAITRTLHNNNQDISSPLGMVMSQTSSILDNICMARSLHMRADLHQVSTNRMGAHLHRRNISICPLRPNTLLRTTILTSNLTPSNLRLLTRNSRIYINLSRNTSRTVFISARLAHLHHHSSPRTQGIEETSTGAHRRKKTSLGSERRW